MMVLQQAAVEVVEAFRVDLQHLHRRVGDFAGDVRRRRCTWAKSRTRRSRRLAMRGVPRERLAISAAPSASQAMPRICAERRTMRVSSSGAVELQALDDAEAVAQRRGQQAGAGGRADQGEGRQVELDRARRRALADHDVDLEVLHRRVQHFLDHRREAVDLVDEQHVVRLQVGQQRGQVAGLLDHRAGGLAQVDAQLVGDDVR